MRDARVNLRIKGLNGGRLKVGNRFTAAGTPRPPTSRVEKVHAAGPPRYEDDQAQGRDDRSREGSELQPLLDLAEAGQARSGTRVQAVHKRSDKLTYSQGVTSKAFKIKIPVRYDKGNRSSTVKLFNELLARPGLRQRQRAKSFDAAHRSRGARLPQGQPDVVE